MSANVAELKYGERVRRPPIVATVLSDEVRQLLLDSLPSDKKGVATIGFEEHQDCPQCPGHKYMEGYFHAVAGSHNQTVASIHPRYGCELDRRPAPLPLAAFCEALRRANAKGLSDLEKALAGMRSASALRAAINRGAQFADLSVQLHWGDAIEPQDVAWHIDAPNSFLHLALGLQGRRALHAVLQGNSRGPSAYANAEVLWQGEGAAYLSSPCCFPHGVEYPAYSWEERIVAVQCRLLLNFDELFSQRDQIDNDPEGQTANVVFRWLSQLEMGALAMPSIDQVQDVLREMSA